MDVVNLVEKKELKVSRVFIFFVFDDVKVDSFCSKYLFL